MQLGNKRHIFLKQQNDYYQVTKINSITFRGSILRSALNDKIKICKNGAAFKGKIKTWKKLANTHISFLTCYHLSCNWLESVILLIRL